jgi:CBS-domain-containing membrane protein
MRVAEVMSPCVISVADDASVFDAAELLVGAGVSGAPVVDPSGSIVGIVTEADLMRRAEIGTEPHKSFLGRLFSDDAKAAAEYTAFHSHHVRDVMTRKVVTVDMDAPLSEAADLMAKHKVKRLPVLRDKEVVGVVSRANLLQALLSREPAAGQAPRSDDEIRKEVQSVVAKQPWTSPWPTNVVVNSGVVHLWGFVQSDVVANAYRVAAENVKGVHKVKNHMRRVPASANMGV